MDKIAELLERRVDKVYPSKKALEKVLRSGKKIRLYLGIDPTAKRLHLGHTVPLRTLQAFADLGHEAIFLFGDGTVLVGDPSEREAGRKQITEKEIKKNISTWKKQMTPVVNFRKVKIKHNKDWLTKLTLKELIEIGSKISAIQLFKRDNFQERLKKGDTVLFHETMYPLLQGYDSVAMDVDLEIGGSDQTFNMLMGRELQKKFRNKEKYVLTLKMIKGTDGRKMSKTFGNCIWLTDTVQDIYGRIMRISDDLIAQYFEFFTSLPIDEVKKIQNEVKTRPMELKKKLAFTICSELNGEKKASQAESQFKTIHQDRGVPEKIKEIDLKTGEWNLLKLLIKSTLVSSKSEAKRLIKQGAVSLNLKRIKDINKKVNLSSGDVLKTGKRSFIKIK